MKPIDYAEIVKEDLKQEFAVLDAYRDMTVEETAAEQANATFPFSVCLLNVTGELNVGSVVRTSCTMGAEEVIIFGRRRYDKRSAVNAWAYQKITRIDGLLEDGLTIDSSAFWNFIVTNKFLPIFIETGGEPLHAMRWQAPLKFANKMGWKILLVLGTERSGIPTDILENQLVVSIPMRGVLRSMNVGHAAAMVIWDLRSKMGWF